MKNPQSQKSDEQSEDLDSKPKKSRLEFVQSLKSTLNIHETNALFKNRSFQQKRDDNSFLINEPEIKSFIDQIVKKYEFDENLEELQSDSLFIAKI